MKNLLTILVSVLALNGCSTVSGFLAGDSGRQFGWVSNKDGVVGVYEADSSYCHTATALIPDDKFNRRLREYQTCISLRGYHMEEIVFDGTAYVATGRPEVK